MSDKIDLKKEAPGYTPDKDKLKGLIRTDRDFDELCQAIDSAVWRSFGGDIREDPFSIVPFGIRASKAEIKRRFEICYAYFRQARGEMGLSMQQTLDLMYGALRAELDKTPLVEPVKGRLWTPS